MVEDDAATYASWAVDPVFCAHAEWRVRDRPGDAVPWWQSLIAEPPPLLLRLAAVHEGIVVGYVDLHGEGAATRELGYLIGPAVRWGRGLGTAAAAAGLAYGFDALGLARIWAEAVEANNGSVRVLEKLGMRETGPGDPAPHLGEPSRFLRFEISRDEYERSEGNVSGS